MFFDAPKADAVYQQLLIDIAQKQQQLLYYRFDWDKRICRQWPPKGLLGKDKKAIARYDALLTELEQLKQKAVAHRQHQGYISGTFWWNIPWEQVENYLICDLDQTSELGNWRYARKWEIVRKDDLCVLCLHEEGHCSDFTGEHHYHYEEISKYSDAERSQMARDYNNRLTQYDLARLAFCDGPVRSVYGTEFNSMADYMLSTDYFLYREYLDSSYRRSLYTEHHTNSVTVTSHSIHYRCTFLVGGYHLRSDGVLDHVSLFDYALCGSCGQMPDSLPESYKQLDASVALAAYIADQPELSVVPVQLFGKDIMDSAGNYSEAMRQAQLYTCLAHKLKFTD